METIKFLTLTRVSVRIDERFTLKSEAFKLTSSHDAANFMRDVFSDSIDIYESFFCAYIDRANNIIAIAQLSQGGVSGTVVDPKMVFKYAIDVLASGIVLFHNHPSSNTTPSELDKKLTKKLSSFSKMIDIPIIDHIILTKESYYSFSDEGILH